MSDNRFFIIIILFSVFCFYAVGSLIFKKHCLEQGYPESQITVNFDGYCIGIKDGNSITVKQ